MRINPVVFTTPDHPVVQIREIFDGLDIMMEVSKIVARQGWGLGVEFAVQFISHDQDELYRQGRFMVVRHASELVTSNPDSYNPNTKSIPKSAVAQIGDWWVSPLKDNRSAEVELKWNPGLKKHEVKSGDEVLFASDDKEEAQEFYQKQVA